ncbi:MAG: hypothetical protein ABSF48_10320 [Thermodesulfobacteriota bacterium]|jgi:hypothetical protein
MAEYLPAIAAMVTIVGSGVSTGLALSAKPVNVPTMPTYQIPSEDLNAINQQIAANTQLSDQSRAVAQQALASYNAGQLSDAYSGQYEQLVAQQTQQVKEQLAGQGFTEGSTQYQSAMEQLDTWSASLKSQMLQSQLQGALSTAGLSDTAVNDYLNKWGVASGVTTGSASSTYQGTLASLMGSSLSSQQAAAGGKAVGGLSSATAQALPTLSSLFKPTPSTGVGLGAGLGGGAPLIGAGPGDTGWTYPG